MRLTNVVVENCSDPMPWQTQPQAAGTSHRQRFEKPTGRSTKEKKHIHIYIYIYIQKLTKKDTKNKME